MKDLWLRSSGPDGLPALWLACTRKDREVKRQCRADVVVARLQVVRQTVNGWPSQSGQTTPAVTRRNSDATFQNWLIVQQISHQHAPSRSTKTTRVPGMQSKPQRPATVTIPIKRQPPARLASAHSLRSLAHRLYPPRLAADGALQLPPRAENRWPVPPPHRGHRPSWRSLVKAAPPSPSLIAEEKDSPRRRTASL